jgi:ElaB/YqjD/DUF883 family membrane-anchored ribosome-binding protein
MSRTAEAQMRRSGNVLAGELEDLINSATELLESVKDQRGEAIDALRSRASRNLDKARQRAASLKPQMREAATRAADTATWAAGAATDFARRNPWSSVAIGTAVAAAVAILVYASSSRR